VRVETGEAGIEYDVTGQGRPVILLHGFPDSGRLWRNQVPALADAGFRVIVPDLRGYGRSDKPGTASSYSLASLAGDVMAVLTDAGAERAHVVGHDWGAALGWVFASLVPDRVDHLAVLSVGHPSTFRRTLEQNGEILAEYFQISGTQHPVHSPASPLSPYRISAISRYQRGQPRSPRRRAAIGAAGGLPCLADYGRRAIGVPHHTKLPMTPASDRHQDLPVPQPANGLTGHIVRLLASFDVIPLDAT
jgi:pimeloyl-ACP methyl ester carboxylesterase